ncbi:hypothetical protein BDB00DRAFT_811311 [Zychaea mexicana]|uniref:uncharacterized protein n=1 Tax=Zychaea mexicana TaxID=64656 RepID=UPI0022FDC3A8|nr:uncharacterized protein BDB00DRAFT_811311 [Zychaea mexicana]KAI9495991.1 hypothetical protein BDB00DRAFT_811311 [Zychaea mexicana]
MVALHRCCCCYDRGLQRRRQLKLAWTVVVLIMAIMVRSIEASSPAVVQPIKEVLDSDQGYDTDLSDPTPFGYIFRIDAPFRRFGPDQPIHQHNHPREDEGDDQSFPSYAMMVLKNVTYISAEAPIYFEGYVSIDALHRLRKRSLTNSPVTFQFSTYSLNQVLESWFLKFQSGSESNDNSDLRGRITDVRVVEPKGKKEDDGTWRPLVQMEISPIPGLLQVLSYKEGVKDEPIEVFWGPSSSSKKNKDLELVVSSTVASAAKNNKAEAAAFHQIVMGDVLF